MDPQSTQAARGKENKEKSKKIIWILILVVVIAGLAGGAYYLLQTPEGMLNPSPTPQLDPFPSPTPAEMEEEVLENVDKEDIAIEVLNGTGISGEAGLLQDELEDLGYSDIEVGNADNQDNETTQVFLTEEFNNTQERKELVEALEDFYESVKVTTEAPDSFDVRIVTGLRKGQTPKPEATSTPKNDEDTDTTEETATPSPTPTSTAE